MYANKSILLNMCAVSFWERLTYFSLFVSVVLILKNKFGMSEVDSLTLYQNYVALAFALPVFGGLFCDITKEYKFCLLSGLGLLAIGCAIISFDGLNNLLYGISTVLVAIGLLKPTYTMLVGKHGKTKSETSGKWMAILYATMNVGAFLGAFGLSFLAKHVGWSKCYLIPFVGSLVLFAMISYSKIGGRNEIPAPQTIILKKLLWLALFVLCIVLNIFFIENSTITNIVDIVVLSLLLGYITFVYRNSPKKNDLPNIGGVALVYLLTCIFFGADLQVGSSISLFIDKYILLHIGAQRVETTTLLSLSPLLVVAIAPFIVKTMDCWEKFNVKNTLMKAQLIGFMCGAIAFSLLAYISMGSTASGGFTCIILFFLFLGLGELLIASTALAAITANKSDKLSTTLVGGWYLCVAISGKLSTSLIGHCLKKNPDQLSTYHQVFIYTSGTLMIACLFVLAFNKKLSRISL